MSEQELEVLAMRYVRDRPGYHNLSRLWKYLMPKRYVYVRVVWRLWRRGAIRVDWRLRLWPVKGQ